MRPAIDMTGLPQSLVEAIEAIIRAYRERETAAPSVERKVGWARNDLPELPQSFFDDLPDDLLELFEKKAA